MLLQAALRHFNNTPIFLQLHIIARCFDVVFDSGWTELTDRAPHSFTGWLRPLQHCDLPPSDPSWQRREPFKDSNCGEQTLDALCRAPPAGLGTASTLLALMLPRSIEGFCECKQAAGERRERGSLKREMYYLFPLGFAPFNKFHFNVSFTDCLSIFIKWREREKKKC